MVILVMLMAGKPVREHVHVTGKEAAIGRCRHLHKGVGSFGHDSLICFQVQSLMKILLPLSCLDGKYEATMRNWSA